MTCHQFPNPRFKRFAVTWPTFRPKSRRIPRMLNSTSSNLPRRCLRRDFEKRISGVHGLERSRQILLVNRASAWNPNPCVESLCAMTKSLSK
jgi:hypothetical protein